MIKAIALDIDGTITDNNSILCLEAISIIRKLEENKIKVILSSGNALCVVKTLSKYIFSSVP